MTLEAVLESWKKRARTVRRDVRALYLAQRNPRMPWYARLFAVAILAYALSPIDLIPNFIPVLGYVDDLVLLPLGIILLVKMISPDLLNEYRKKAEESNLVIAKNWVAALAIIALWCCGLALTWTLLRRFLAR